MKINQRIENLLFIAVCLFVLLVVLTINPYVLPFLAENWRVIAGLALSVAFTAPIAYYLGYRAGFNKGRSTGFELGYAEAKGLNPSGVFTLTRS